MTAPRGWVCAGRGAHHRPLLAVLLVDACGKTSLLAAELGLVEPWDELRALSLDDAASQAVARMDAG